MCVHSLTSRTGDTGNKVYSGDKIHSNLTLLKMLWALATETYASIPNLIASEAKRMLFASCHNELCSGWGSLVA